ncbi:MAG: mechanosensitive ion channel [Angelakisella sp.]
MMDQFFGSFAKTALFEMGTWVGRLALTVVLGIIVIKILMHFLDKLLQRSKLNPAAVPFLLAVSRIFFYVLLGISVATSMGIVEPSSLVTALGAVGLAVSLAIKDSLSNLMGGVLLIIFKIFTLGDYVEIDGISGTVAEIGLVHTILTTVDNKRISIPNGQVTNARVINYSSEATRRVDIFLTIDRGSDIEAAKAVLMEMITSHPLTLKDPEPTVHAEGHTELGTKLGCRIWVNRQDYWTVYYDIVEQLKDKLAAAGITMPTKTVI